MKICIDTNRLLLRELTEQDLPGLARIAAQPHIGRWLPDWGDCASRIEGWFPSVREGYRVGNPEKRLILLAIEEKRSRRVVGQIHIGREFEEYGPGELGMGCFIAEEALNRGYASEAVEALLDYARKTWAFSCFAALVRPGNEASARVLEKNGFQEHGMLTVRVKGSPVEFRLFRTPAPTAPITARHCPGCGMVFPQGTRQCPICGAMTKEISGEALKRLRAERNDFSDAGRG